MSIKIKDFLKKVYCHLFLGKWAWIVYVLPMESLKKYQVILSYQEKLNLKNLVETGTYKGDAVEACRQKFEHLYSIELSEDLYKKAKERFKNYSHIELLYGDSGLLLPKLLSRINGSVLFWLDGHYSTGITAKGLLETPVLAEIKSIFNSGINNYCILIDDARFFTGLHDYPKINVLKKIVKNYNKDLLFEVKDDIIRIYPGTV